MAMMISKFHKIIQSKVVWGAFAVLISVAFVGVYTPGAGDRSKAKQDRQRSQLAGRLYGEDISNEEFGQAWAGTRVMAGMYRIIDSRFNITDDQMIQAAWQRLATLKKAEQLGMTVQDEQTIALIQRHPLFQNQETGQYDPNIYTMFVNQILPQLRMTQQGFLKIFEENVLIEKVSAIPAQGGLVSDEEIKKEFHLYTDLLTVEYASIPRSLAAAPKTTEEGAKNYYMLNKEEFLMPANVLVHYVQFPVADFLDQVEVTEEMVAQAYEENKQRYLKDPAEDAAADAAPEFKPLEEVKDEIVADLKTWLARKAAAEQADELVAELADPSMTFETAAEQAGLEIVANTPRFGQTDLVKGVDPTAPFARDAFMLNDDETHYYSDPVIGRDFVYVIALKQKYDAFLPAFDVVADAALEAAKLADAETAYIEKAEQIHREIQTALKSETSFAEAVKKQKLELQTTVPFNATSNLEDEFGREIMMSTIRFEKGTLTDLIATPDEFLVAFVAEKVPGDEATALPGMRDELANSIGNEKASRLVNAWRDGLLEEAGFEDLMPRSDDES